MKKTNILLIVALITSVALGCGSKGAEKEQSTTNVSSSVNKKSTDDTRFDNIDANQADEPIMGGPADFTVTMKDRPDLNGKGRLVGLYMDQNFLADTAVVKNGRISFKKPEGYAQGLYYVGFPGDKYIQVLLGEDQKFELEFEDVDPVETMKVKGSEDNELYYSTSRWENEVNPKITELAKKLKLYPKGTIEYTNAAKAKTEADQERMAYLKDVTSKSPNSLFSKFKLGGQNPILKTDLPEDQQVTTYRKEFWDNVDLMDKRMLRTPVIGNKLKRFITELTPQLPDSIISSAELLMNYEMAPEYFKNFANWIVLKYEPTKTDLMDPEAVFVHMIQKYFTKEKAYWAEEVQVIAFQKRAHEMAQSLVGNEAPNVISTDQFGKTQELLAKDADYLIVYMYNPDCEHCQEQSPKLLDYWKKNKGEVDVFAIAIETDETKWKNYIKKNNLTWTNVFDPTNKSIYAKYYVDITPELYVINKDREIIGKNLKVFQIDTVINRDKEKRN